MGLGLIVLLLYFLPSLIAALRSHHNGGAIFMLNLLLGWTIVGWIIALIWSCTSQPRTPSAALAPKPGLGEQLLGERMLCIHCGTALPDHAALCTNCGRKPGFTPASPQHPASAVTVHQARFCASCGAERAGGDFCVACGAKLA